MSLDLVVFTVLVILKMNGLISFSWALVFIPFDIYAARKILALIG
jgi:hypothetical protein